ncbi:MAG: transglutaminase domain-containing protein, partial [Lachnospiraceae bacterium]|nr:transglutaminase domain-containing protein [Lachnospiraceae bacterium]
MAKKADELETPLAIYSYLKNNIGYEYYYGSRKGAKGVLASMNGNDLDQASLLLAMLRYKGYPSVYVRGEIVLTGQQAMALTGADTIQNAANVLTSCGNPTTVLARNNVPYSVKMEHVWVRTYIPVGDYRGTGDVSGEAAWIDLDTGIKEYEAVDNIYDEFANADIKYSLEDIASVTDSAQLESMSNELLGQLDTSKEIYTKKRIIKKEELLYLPLSLQYEVRKEKGEFVEVDENYKDKVSLSINGQEFADIYASDVFGKNIIISYEPSTNADKEILDQYGDVFKTPAYAVEMKTVLLIDGEKVAEGEFGDYNTLGEVQNFTMDLYSNNGVTSVDNKLHVGSMYALTLDNGFISGDELQNAYDEVAAIKDALSEDKVYSAKQLGNMLAFAGKLYFSQVDLMDMSFAETYDVAATRTLSEGITGYEAEPIYSYGMVRGLDYGKLYIDVDTDAHCVKSLTGKTEDETEYMINSGINSSINESLVWEEITGEQSISTMSILETAEEQGIEIEMIAPRNLDEKLALLDVDDAVKDAVVKNVNAGNIVTIPRENVLIGEWYGTGYISLNPETGEGEYIISGGLSGGSSSEKVVAAAMVTYGLSVIDMIEAMLMIVEAVKLIALGSALATAGSVVLAGLAIFSIISTMVLTVQTSLLIMAYAEGDDKAAEKIINEMWLNLALTIGTAILGSIA